RRGSRVVPGRGGVLGEEGVASRPEGLAPPARVEVAAAERDTHPDRWRILVLLAVAELLGMSLWFSGNAVASILQARWQLTGEQVGWLTTMVQLGFVAGTAVTALLNL